jgi:hypothetical protein
MDSVSLVDGPLYLEYVALVFSLRHQCSADHLGGGYDIEKEGFSWVRHDQGRR